MKSTRKRESPGGNVNTLKESEKRTGNGPRIKKNREMRSEEARPEEIAIMYATGTHFLPRIFRILTA